jgi:hypothetical protein
VTKQRRPRRPRAEAPTARHDPETVDLRGSVVEQGDLVAPLDETWDAETAGIEPRTTREAPRRAPRRPKGI